MPAVPGRVGAVMAPTEEALSAAQTIVDGADDIARRWLTRNQESMAVVIAHHHRDLLAELRGDIEELRTALKLIKSLCADGDFSEVRSAVDEALGSGEGE